jgi:glycosyltransferase involved in cell wall biosynthesis
METVPDYSVLVPAFNEEDLLPGTLAALRIAMDSVPWRGEVIVCDNNSTDGTARVARSLGATVVFEPVNQISRSRNRAASAARGRWLFMVDADTRIPAELLRDALARLATGTVCGGGAFVEMDAPAGTGVRILTAAWHTMSRRFHLAAGAFVFVTREAFDAVGGFSEKVYAGEEIGFSRAAGRWGRRRGLTFDLI